MRRFVCVAAVAVLALPGTVPTIRGAETVDDLLRSTAAALDAGQADRALALAGKEAEAAPKDSRPYLLRGRAQAALRRHAEAVADFDRAIALDPKAAAAYDERGSEHFKLGHVAESLQDFDRFLQLRPEARPAHWKRGISCFYAGRFDEGRQQFEAGREVYHDDVENAAWHFLCVARLAGLDKARASLLKIGQDPRVPLMEVYALYAGKAKPDAVLAAARAGKPGAAELNERLFYAHLYLGLYADVTGEPKQALDHLTRAVEDHPIDHYMWDVARLHRDRLRAKGPK
ncbi:MAG TPA: tetratricopeptide repeat protein [Gemmataceae bacterium]|nr:tetratricopeptide repeat protein [Gemmataceae bacterium]